MKILVTGGAGFIGSNLSCALLEEGYWVVGIDNFDPYYRIETKKKNLDRLLKYKNYKFYEESILAEKKLQEIFANEKPEKICHLAAKAGVRPSIQNPKAYEEVNIRGTLNLLELAKDFQIKNFILASSSSVYGQQTKVPFSEEDRTDWPLSPYAASKKAAEILLSTYHSLYHLNTTILRFFTVYGPSGRPDMAPYLFTESILKGRPIKKFGDTLSQRDYTYIDDIVQGVIAALDKNFEFEIINLGNGKPITLSELIETIEQILEKKAIIEPAPSQLGDAAVTWADITKAKKLLNYSPEVSLAQGLVKFIDWYRETVGSNC